MAIEEIYSIHLFQRVSPFQAIANTVMKRRVPLNNVIFEVHE
jgi:hypothetical protein